MSQLGLFILLPAVIFKFSKKPIHGWTYKKHNKQDDEKYFPPADRKDRLAGKCAKYQAAKASQPCEPVYLCTCIHTHFNIGILMP